MMPPSTMPPGPKGMPFVGSLLPFFLDMPKYLQGVARKYGNLASFELGPRKVVLVNRPDVIADIFVNKSSQFIKSRGLQRAKLLLGNGLVTSEGAFHLRQRRMSQPAFHKNRMPDYCQTMVDYTIRLRETLQDGQKLDVNKLMNGLTLDIVTKTLFGADIGGSEARDVSQALSEILHIFPIMLMPFSELLDRLPKALNRVRLARQRLDNILYRIVEERRRSTGGHTDLLEMLLKARDVEGDGTGMTDEQLRDELMTMFLAGHETTANALSWIWMLLAQNPAVEHRLSQEISAALGERAPSYPDLERLPYARQVVAESMRLYPPAFILGRETTQPYRIDDYNFSVGTVFFMSPYVMHRTAEYYPDPERFDPERFASGVERPKFSYFPFGGGNRICIGERFAWAEAILLMVTMMQKWRFELAPFFEAKTRATMVLRPRFGVPVTVRRR